ncbi:MAG: BMP family ABC transporter substrate-binding protein [Eubacteriales bacterium]|jgi:basic membrane lipoprotein Med (substrate-binding protein (PBP1-ABC) superfamily)|nr:BMP family ABC transporter substrate-binding protein [Eubacteriales bacterium]MDD4105021.1 BMP family ABC transporter substrate-binding protein [Eubacteriales bacterium]MDD4710621.1 BMP family ABC transporter substrate-binding protein [Eubacteriales bacterium]NLO14508.1 BMP family ABC transporter substrate-binding protein [Clostridiales bacterium]
MQHVFEVEARSEYEKARKQGQKDYSARTARGLRGTLLVLDEVAEQNRVMAYVKRPTMEIPLSLIIGTYTSSRAYSFSASFLPLHHEGSEFSYKWIALYAALLEEGLRDAIQVYEYMWHYYVVEGNKRVSVLKHLGAPTVRAEITRMIPQLDPDDPDTAVYYAFLHYDRKGLFKGVRLSTAEKYRHLEEMERFLVKDAPEGTTVDYNNIYLQFHSACAQVQPALPVGDVMLEYFRLYGIPYDTVLSEITSRVLAMQPQLELISQPDKEPTLVLDPKEEVTESLVSRLFSPRRTARILFGYEEGRTESNWIGAHEKGRRAMQQEMGARVETRYLDHLSIDNCYETLSQNTDTDLVLLTSTNLATPALRFALEHPDIMTLVYSRVRQDSRLSTYYGRYYEVVFLCGVAAGFMTKTGKVAYVTPQTDKRYTPDVNAFGLGVKSVNPRAEVMLVQKNVSPFDPASCRLGLVEAAAQGADVALTPRYDRLDLPGVPDDAFSAVVEIDEGGRPFRYICSPAWDWGRYYTEIARSYLNNSLDVLKFIGRDEAGVAGLWWGIGTGVLRFRMAEAVHPAAQNLLHYLRNSIALGRFNPFHGPVFDRDGVLRVASKSDPKPYDILNMEWIADFIRIIE